MSEENEEIKKEAVDAKAPAEKTPVPEAEPSKEEAKAEAEEPKAEEPKAKKSKAKAEEPKAEAEEPKAEAEEPKAKKSKAKTEEPKAEEAEAKEPKAKAEEAEAGEAKAEEPKVNPLTGEVEGAPAPKIRKIKGSKNVSTGIVHIRATFNNTQVTITDMKGNSISWSSSGKGGFKGSRKSTAFAATSVAMDAAKTAMTHGMQEVEIRVQGPGAGRESAIRAIQSAGLRVNSIKDVTPIPHNGCRARKRRRV